MTAKEILALAQAHRKEPSRANYDALAYAVRELFDELSILRDASNHWRTTFDKQKAEIELLRTDAELWRAYKARKDSVLAAGMGRSPLRSDPERRPQNCGTNFCSCIECVMKEKP